MEDNRGWLLPTRPRVSATPLNTNTPAPPEAASTSASTPSALALRLGAVLATSLAGGSAAANVEAALRATAQACTQELAERWSSAQASDRARLDQGGERRVHYLSMEFLMGRALGNALAALGAQDGVRRVLAAQGVDLPALLEREHDAALGNGGLGRLAACFLDAMAELGVPAFGYGLRYRYGMFAQHIQDGRQVEAPDDWMAHGNPWDVARPETTYLVGLGGRVVSAAGSRRWIPAELLRADAFDFIVPAHHDRHVATLRQWQASANDPIDLAAFNRGDLIQASDHQRRADALNWVLYPDDSTAEGRLLRLQQEAFLCSASMQDLLARHLREHGNLQDLGRRNAIHLNDTHPALAPAELMRLLLDEHGLPWDEAWSITRQAVSYTNHTLMPEALETWPLRLFEEWLPRHLEIIYQINQDFLQEVAARMPDDSALLARVSLIDETGERRVRMAGLAILASHKVNGVSALHSALMVQTIFADYARLFPGRFHNITNGITPRRWLAQANPALSNVIDKHIGNGWRRNLGDLARLRPLAADATLCAEFMAAKRDNKLRLAERLRSELGVTINPDSLFDVQAKRIHEYKRQLLNLLHVVARYQAICANPGGSFIPRTVIIAGKAASAYHSAKLIIQLAHDIGRVINSDARCVGRLQLVFVPNYGVSWAELLVPAADLSEQISTAGTEASGTGNMKFALNGALTIGTWDGANIEMAQAMDPANMFVFGLRAEAVAAVKLAGYDPRLYVEQNPMLRTVLDAIASGHFNPQEPQRYGSLVDGLLGQDNYLLLADFSAYVDAQAKVDELFANPAAWAERALLNVAAMGWFSADRTVADYVQRVWSTGAR